MRATLVAAIGGLVVGHIFWLIAISIAIATTTVNRWVLIVSAVIAVLAVAAVVAGWRLYRGQSHVWAAFLWSLPISPVLLTLCVLGVTYL